MKEKILKVTTAIALIITLTMANVLVLCDSIVSYAANAISETKSTSHKNVEFMAYFKDSNGNKVSSLDEKTNSEDMKMYLQVSVKQNGYFNGQISLKNSNFKFKTDIQNDIVNKIDENNIYLNQINAGDTKEIEVGIEFVKDSEFDLSLISIESKLGLSGIYRDETEKNISITATRTVRLHMVSPYQKGDNILSQEVITNKILNYNGVDKKVVQIKVTSGIKDNLFPIKATSLEIVAPKILDKFPKTVLVSSVDNLTTNNKKLSDDMWNYNTETGTMNITINNENAENKVSWLREGNDTFIITYIFDETGRFEEQSNKISSKIELYDDNKTVFTASHEMGLSNEEKDSIFKIEQVQNETSIYKGKLYYGIDREFTYKTILNTNLLGVASSVNILDKDSNSTIKSIYKTTKINKQKMIDILGKNGRITIVNADTNKQLAIIDAQTEVNENGDIIVEYKENVENIKMILTAPQKIEKLEIENTKTIVNANKNTIKTANEIVLNVEGTYTSVDKENNIEETESKIELKETETSAKLEINKTELSTMTTNQNVEFRVTLQSKEESNELFKNPVVKIQLPEKIENIKVNSISLIYEDELKIKSSKLNGKTIEITFDGEQTKYKDEAIDGAVLLINADLTINKKATSSTETVTMTYTNANAINYKNGANVGTEQQNINIVSYAGLVTTNQISDYGINVINNDGEKTAKLQTSETEKNVTIEKNIINNNEDKISNVKILGTFPTKDAVSGINNIDTLIKDVIKVTGIDSSKIKVYYSNNEKATADLENTANEWQENITNSANVKKYLIIVDELDKLEEIDISYGITIPENLEYNEVAQEGYNVYYTNTNNSTESSVELDKLTLETGKGPVVDTTLNAFVAGEERTQEVKEGEIIKYTVTVSNTGTEDMTNINVVGKVPEGTTYVEKSEVPTGMTFEDVEYKPFTEYKDRKNVEFNIEKLAVGETTTQSYLVKVNKGTKGTKISNELTTKYGDVTKKSNELINEVKEANIEIELYSTTDNEKVTNGYTYGYIANVINTSNEELKNVKVNVLAGDIFNVKSISYTNSENKNVIERTNKYIVIDKIPAGKTQQVVIDTMIDSNAELTNSKMNVTAEQNKETYYSNQLEFNVKIANIELYMTSNKSNNYVKAGETIEYKIKVKNIGTENLKEVQMVDSISNKTTLTEVQKNGKVLGKEQYSVQNSKLIVKDELAENETVEYTVKAIVNKIPGNTKAMEIPNSVAVSVDGLKLKETTVKHILQPESNSNNNGNNNGNNGNGGNTNNGGNTDNPNSTATTNNVITGTAWLDKNNNGQKDTTEQLLSGIVVRLVSISNNETAKDTDGKEIVATTDNNGFYSLNKVPNGEYIVIFEYDTSKYILTTYEKAGVSEENNSKVINKKITQNNEEKTVGATEIIKLDNKNVANINIGLQEAKVFDLKLDKTVNRITIQNSKGTVTKEYDNATLAKAEIDAKLVNATTVVVEYTIKVTNEGEVDAYVRKIADYLSSDYKFSSELNKDWYQADGNVYTTSLANQKIVPGESKEIKLIVTKQMTESNTGLIPNTAEIVESYNELGLQDVDSTAGNKVKDEDDMGTAEVILSIKTGEVITTITLIITTVAILLAGSYLIARKITHGRIF